MTTKHTPATRRKPVKYSVTLRSGLARDYTSKRDAIRACRDERRDGWPSHVRDLRTDEIVL